MKAYPIIATATALFDAALAASVGVREAARDGRQFEVTDYEAGCIAHSTQCYLSFNATTSPRNEPLGCSWNGPGPDIIPNIPFTLCQEPFTYFSYRSLGSNLDSYELTIVNIREKMAGSKFWESTDYPIIPGGAVNYQQFQGDRVFTINV